MVARATTFSVLIVDAEPYICRVFAAKLTKDNQFLVSSASNGSDAIEAAKQRIYDVILWDMRLRETLSILPRLRAICPGASLILSTTDDRPSILTQISILDVSDILVKPFGLDTLVDRVSEALRHKSDVLPGHSARMDIARVGQLISIDSNEGRCETRVLESGQDYFSVVGKPRVDTPPDFNPGLSLKVSVLGEDGIYTFRSQILRERKDSMTLWDLNMPDNIQRIQRRKSSRISLQLPVILHKSAASIDSRSQVPILSTADISHTTSDISLGGFALVSNELHPVGEYLEFNINSKEYEVTGSCKVLRSNPWNYQVGFGIENSERYRTVFHFESFRAQCQNNLKLLISSLNQS